MPKSKEVPAPKAKPVELSSAGKEGKAVTPPTSPLGAHAFTQGTDIHFGTGSYAPTEQAGKALLAHELAHTIQQQETAATKRK